MALLRPEKKEKAVDIQASATVDWSPLGDIYVKKYVNYHLDWQVNLAHNMVAMAPYGGPVALLPRAVEKKGEKTAEQKNTRAISIYTLSGQLISTIPLEGGRVVGLGWSSSEKLICILEEGTMVVYNVHGHLIFSRSIAREVRNHRVLECKFFHTLEGSAGFAVMTYNYQFFVVGDSDREKDELRVKKMADLPSAPSRPSCWAVLPQPAQQLSVVVAMEDRLYLLDQLSVLPQTVSLRKEVPRYWVEMAVSLNGKAIALVDKDGYLWGGSHDFQRCDTEFDLQSAAKIVQMTWGGSDFFVLTMEKLMFVKGFGRHWCNPLRQACFLLPEIDGVRLLTDNCCEFMHRVTSHSLSVLRIGSMDVGALLNDAYKEYEGDESHKADEYIRFIKDRLPDAVIQCIQAAGEEFIPKIQQSLLRSANFGKGFLGPDVPENVVNTFVEMCHQLRVLNFVRSDVIGIPMTLRQYFRLSTGVLIDRLINRGLYPHALEICNYLSIPPASGEVKVLMQWALRQVQDKSVNDDVVAEKIIAMLKQTSVVVSYAEIARSARAEGRNPLAAQLLDHEVYAKDQVPLLMEMRKADMALDKAIESGDPQLVYRVLDDLKNRHYGSQMDRYLQVFHHRPVAAALYKKLCKEMDPEQLLNLCRQESDFLEAGCLLFAQSFTRRDPADSRRCVAEAMKEFRDGQHLFHLKVAEDQARLTKEQLEIESKYGMRVLGLSLFNTVFECVKAQLPKVAEQLRKDLRLTDNQYWWAKIRGLAAIGDYAELERFSKHKKSPIGYEPFAEVCIQHGNFREASKYVAKAATENRFRLYMAIEDYPKAAEAAFQDRSIPELEDVESKVARNPQLLDHVKQLKGRLGYK